MCGHSQIEYLAERLRELRATPDVAHWWDPAPEGWPLEPDPGLHRFTILLDGEVVGYMQFSEEREEAFRHADVDIFLGPDHQGRGLGGEAMRAMLRHLIEERGHHRVTLSTPPGNSRAIRKTSSKAEPAFAIVCPFLEGPLMGALGTGG